MRCYLIAEHPTELSGIREVLADLGVEIVEPARAFDAASIPRRGWLPAIDVVCAVFPADRGWETPASLYLEVGEAVGAGIPVLLVAEPPRRIDAALWPLPMVRVPIRNKVALARHIGIFLESVGKPSTVADPPRVANFADLASVREGLSNIRNEYSLSGSGEAIHSTARRLEELGLRLLQVAGAEAVGATGVDDAGDIAAWVPGTENFLPGPLLVELKILRDSGIQRRIMDQLQHYASVRGAAWSMLLYYRWNPKLRIRLPRDGLWPTVMVFDIEQLASSIQEVTLAEILINERNAIVHGVRR